MSSGMRRWFLVWDPLRGVCRADFCRALSGRPYHLVPSAHLRRVVKRPDGTYRHRASAPILMAGGGIFLIFLFFHWLFLEDKHFGLPGERFFKRQGGWFYAVVSLLLAVIVWFALQSDPLMAFGAVVGSTAFFITHGFKENAERAEKELLSGSSVKSDISKILYLEVIDATFSIDGVLGAFAFTLSVPLILIGNGIGAVVLRKLTVSNIETVKKYIFLKNGAMYSVFFLGLVMLLHAFRVPVPEWVSPLVTFAVVAYFFLKSRQHLTQTQP